MRLAIDAGEHTISAAEELGIRGVPITAADLVAKGAGAVVDPLRAQGLEVCQIGAFGYNPLHPDPAVLAAQTDLVRKAIALAPETGCRYIVVNGGNRHPSGFAHGHRDNFTGKALDAVAAALTPLVALAEKSGVCISIEPYIKSVVSSPERFMKLAAKVASPALRINLDVTNFYDLSDMWNCAATVRRACRRLKGHYGLVHVKDITLREGFHIHIDLAPIDQGATDWALVLREAAPHVPTDSWVILEHVGSMEEARRSAAFLRAAARRAGVELA
jgi:sugar phosphate isomerase/epimerase